MSDQKDLKKRLKVLMNKPENQVCSDCTERQPRWASLIVPPPGAPEWVQTLGAFCCLECSGSHRRLGVHISFVRSINLDSWKEKEVAAMENGGNAKVNAIFEARLPQSGVQKPSNHADGPTRERFIRDKYERRKFYDPNAFIEFQSSTRFATENSAPPVSAMSSPVGPPSDAARQRMQDRNRRLQKAGSTASDSSNEGGFNRRRPSTSQRRPQVAKAPASAPPPAMDLLDFYPDPAQSQQNFSQTDDVFANGTRSDDFFSFDQAANGGEVEPPKHTMSDPLRRRLQRSRSGEQKQGQGQLRRSRSKEDVSNILEKKKSTASEDILSLYGPGSTDNNLSSISGHSNTHLLSPAHQQTSGGYDLGSVTSMMSNMNVQQPAPVYTPEMQQMMMMQQQQYMMQQYAQQQQMMMMQQRMMQQQPQSNNGSNNNTMFQPNSNFMMQQPGTFNSPGLGVGGMAPSMGSGPASSATMPHNSMARRSSKQQQQPEKEDPFAQFSMNAFR